MSAQAVKTFTICQELLTADARRGGAMPNHDPLAFGGRIETIKARKIKTDYTGRLGNIN